jgi:hypothetical protein
MIIPTIVLRTISLFGGIAVERSINKILPISLDLLKSDTIATIGTAIIQAAASDAIMTYIEDRLIDAFDGIDAPAPELVEIPQPAPQQAPKAKPAAKPAATPK